MCRFAAYLGQPLLINELISKPRDSIIRQSFSAQESEVQINADGFGIGWYTPTLSKYPAAFVSVLPAWNDINLKNMSHHISSPCFFAHVRAAEKTDVSPFSCHPFHYQQFMFMHNGSIAGFKKIKLSLLQKLEPQYFDAIKGHTDSEVLFYLWLSYFSKTQKDLTAMVTSWKQALHTISNLQSQAKIQDKTYINTVLTDGNCLIATRYGSNLNDQLSLHYTSGKTFVHQQKGLHMIPEDTEQHESIIIASERMTIHQNQWHDVPMQHLIIVDTEHTIHLETIE